MRFEWDEVKSAANRAKHGVGFETAALVFDDPLHISAPDRVEGGEVRWRTVGAMDGVVLLVVAHTLTQVDGEEVVRIQPESRTRQNGRHMKKLTAKQREDIRRIAAMSDKDIDFSDIPEVTDWSGAVRGGFYRPVKQAVTIRLDADVIDWFRSQGDGYQTRMNHALREYVAQRRTGKVGVHESRTKYSVGRARRK